MAVITYTETANDMAKEGEENQAFRTNRKKTACINSIHPPAEKDTIYMA